MQIIIPTDLSPEAYVEKEQHKRVARPVECPCCGRKNTLLGHGTYSRFVSGTTELSLTIQVRRYRCRTCRHTVSCLPEFAHPYRFINLLTVERFLKGRLACLDVRRHIGLLRRYLAKLHQWAVRAGKPARRGRPRDRAGAPALHVYQGFVSQTYTLARANSLLVNRHHTALLGDYRCHQLPVAC